MIKKMGEKIGKRSQVTVFIILAIVIVAGCGLVYFFFPKNKTNHGVQE